MSPLDESATTAPGIHAGPQEQGVGHRVARLPRRLLHLPTPTWKALARVLPTVAVVRVALSALPYRVVVRAFEPNPRPSVRPGADPRGTLRVAAWTGRTFLGDRPCLTQAIAARWLLARDGYETELKIGAAIEDGEFRAHAWLEANGQVVLGGAGSSLTYHAFRPIHTPHDAAAT